jgi:hypothetical protein
MKLSSVCAITCLRGGPRTERGCGGGVREGEIQMMDLLSIGYHGSWPCTCTASSIACLSPWPAPAFNWRSWNSINAAPWLR